MFKKVKVYFEILASFIVKLKTYIIGILCFIWLFFIQFLEIFLNQKQPSKIDIITNNNKNRVKFSFLQCLPSETPE